MATKNTTAAKTAAAKKPAAKPAEKKAPAEKGERIIKAGGTKGQAIVALLTKEPGLTRAQLAEKIGATTGRVGEVVRFLAAHGTKEEQALIAKHVAAQPARKVAAKKETATGPTRGSSAKSTKTAAPAAKKTTRKPAAKKVADAAPAEAPSTEQA